MEQEKQQAISIGRFLKKVCDFWPHLSVEQKLIIYGLITQQNTAPTNRMDMIVSISASLTCLSARQFYYISSAVKAFLPSAPVRERLTKKSKVEEEEAIVSPVRTLHKKAKRSDHDVSPPFLRKRMTFPEDE
jgi:hypothetical protein